MDMFHVMLGVGFNVSIAMFLYVALVGEIGQLRRDIGRLAKPNRPGRRRARPDPEGRP